MSLRRPPSAGPIRRSQFDGPALELRDALSTKLAAIAQRGAQAEGPEPPEPASDSDELGGEDSDLEPSDDEDDESVASSSGASSPESSPVPSPTIPSPATSALPSIAAPAPTLLSSTLTTALGPAPTSTFTPSNKEEDSDSEDDPIESAETLRPRPTTASATAQAELSSESAFPSITGDSSGAQQSGDVWIMSGPPPKPPPSGLSQPTEHLLIAAGSIGATLLLVMVVWGIYTMRRKGLTFRDLVQMSRRKRGRPDRTYDIAKPQIHRMPAFASDKERYSLPQPPRSSVLRFDSVSSRESGGHRDYLGAALGRRPSTPPRASHRSFYEEATPPRGLSRAPSNAHSRNSSSPTLLPLQTQVPSRASKYDDSPPSLPIQRSASFKGSQAPSRYSSERNDIVSPEAPGPTYQNYTASRRFTTNRGPNFESHFSWTQSSQAPPTPIEPITPRENNGRVSVATTASSVARFRTVDSWVGNQTGRIPSTQLRSQPHFSYRQSTSTNGGLGQVDEGQPGWQQENNPAVIANKNVPEVPSVPSQYKQQTQHQRQLTSYSDATVFRQHPGTEVQIPRGSLVPSEVLDEHVTPSAL